MVNTRAYLGDTRKSGPWMLEEASHVLDLKLLIGRAGNEHEITNAFAMFAQQQAGALLVGADPYFNSQRASVINPAVQLRLPAIYE